MKRPMCTLAVSWLAGLFLAGQEADFLRNAVLVSYFCLLIFGLFVLKKYPHVLNSHVQKEWYLPFTVLLLLIPCMFLAGSWRMKQFQAVQEQKELPWRLLAEEGESYVTVEGIVKEKRCEDYVTLQLTDCVIIGYYGQENQRAGSCRIRVEEEGKEWLPETVPGNKIRVFGQLSVFQPAANPGQFDAHDYYTGQGLFADVSALRITVLEEERDWIACGMFRWKQCLRESLLSLYPEDKAGVLAAMILGDKDLLSEDIETLYRKNGISHILAISGLHISMLCMGLYRILRKCTVPLKLSAAVTACFVVCYIAFTGASTSSLRAGIMCLVLLGAALLRRSYDLLSSLSLAAVLVTAVHPGELDSAGFLLSFGAVLGVALSQEIEWVLLEAKKGKKSWYNLLLFGGMIQCVTIPISLWFFYELSPYSILLNLIVIPLVSLILGGGILSALLGMVFQVAAVLPSGGTFLLLEFYERLCTITQKLPFSFVLLGRPAVWQIALYYILLITVVWLFFRRLQHVQEQSTLVKRAEAGLAAGLLLCAVILFLPGKQKAELLFLDVSQGDSVLIFTEAGAVILSDCGSSDISHVGEYRLAPVLKQKGILLIDMAVVSHLDSDHMSGIKEILEAMPVLEGKLQYTAGYEGIVGMKELVLPKVREKSEAYLELEALAEEKLVAVRYIEAGGVLYQEKNLLIECLSPQDAGESENDTSLVLLLQTPELLAWFMGDAGTDTEKEILKRLVAVDWKALRMGRSVLLKVGHHGSKTSTEKAFVEYVQPDISVISCGYRNAYGHPHDSVVNRLLLAESQVFRTDLQGAVVVELGQKEGAKVYSWLEKQKKEDR